MLEVRFITFMRYIVLFFCVLVSSCSNPDASTAPLLPSAPVSTIPAQQVYLNAINTLLSIPLEYRKISVEDYYAIPDSLVVDEAYRAEVQATIDQLNNATFTTSIFVDSSNYDNAIWVFYGRFLPHVPINRETAPQAVAMLKQQAKMDPYPIVFTEQQLGRTKTFSYIKMKAIESYEEEQRYLVFYFISSSQKSFIVKIFNEEDVDFQSLINKTVFRPNGPS